MKVLVNEMEVYDVGCVWYTWQTDESKLSYFTTILPPKGKKTDNKGDRNHRLIILQKSLKWG